MTRKKVFFPKEPHLMVSALASRFLGPTSRHYPSPLGCVAVETQEKAGSGKPLLPPGKRSLERRTCLGVRRQRWPHAGKR